MTDEGIKRSEIKFGEYYIHTVDLPKKNAR
jgi:hypothetical protein